MATLLQIAISLYCHHNFINEVLLTYEFIICRVIFMQHFAMEFHDNVLVSLFHISVAESWPCIELSDNFHYCQLK